VKVFVHFLVRTLVFVAVACLLWFVLGWRSWGMIGGILAAAVGAVVAFAVGYLVLDRQRRAAAEQFGSVVSARQAGRAPRESQADRDADIEDSFQDQLRRQAGLDSEARAPRSAPAFDAADDEAR